MVEQLDPEGWDKGLLKEIISVRKDSNVAISGDEDAFATLNGIRRPIITTKGWDVHILWHDGSTSWAPLSLVKLACFSCYKNQKHTCRGLWYQR